MEGNTVINIICLIAVAVLLLGSVTWMAPQDVDVPTADEIAKNVNIPDVPVVNLTSVEDRLADIETTLDEDDDWEDEAEDLATDEWEDNDYKDIYKALNNLYGWVNETFEKEIDDRDEIIYVREAKDTTFSGMDVDDEDAIVYQFVKVKYEDVAGDNQIVRLTIETEIEEGEVEDQDIRETPIIVVSTP